MSCLAKRCFGQSGRIHHNRPSLSVLNPWIRLQLCRWQKSGPTQPNGFVNGYIGRRGPEGVVVDLFCFVWHEGHARTIWLSLRNPSLLSLSLSVCLTLSERLKAHKLLVLFLLSACCLKVCPGTTPPTTRKYTWAHGDWREPLKNLFWRSSPNERRGRERGQRQPVLLRVDWVTEVNGNDALEAECRWSYIKERPRDG